MKEEIIETSDVYAGKNGVLFFRVRVFWGAGPNIGTEIAPAMEVHVRVERKGKKQLLLRAEQFGDQPEFWIEVNDGYYYLSRINRVGEDQKSSNTSVGTIRCDNSSYSMELTFLRFYEIPDGMKFMDES